jgi:tetratricopeptide (TPR) repeat protein
VAVSQGVGAVVTGELSRRGDQYSLSATALDSQTGNVIAKAEATAATKDEVLLTIPKLAAPIRKALGDSTSESAQLQAAGGAFTAASLEAVHEYGVAMNQQFAGNFEAALQSFTKAAQLDPNFARAYAGQAAVAGNLGQYQDAEKYAKLAMAHVDRMTERERFRIRGMYYIRTENWQKCIEEYSELLKQYPADNIAHNNMAACYAGLRDMPKAVEEARRAVEIAPKDLLARNNYSLYACYTGDFKTCEREGREVRKLNPSSEDGFLLLGYSQIGQGQPDKASETYQELGSWDRAGHRSQRQPWQTSPYMRADIARHRRFWKTPSKSIFPKTTGPRRRQPGFAFRHGAFPGRQSRGNLCGATGPEQQPLRKNKIPRGAFLR